MAMAHSIILTEIGMRGSGKTTSAVAKAYIIMIMVVVTLGYGSII